MASHTPEHSPKQHMHVGSFDTVDPETLQLVMDDPVSDSASGTVIYSVQDTAQKGRSHRIKRPYGEDQWRAVGDAKNEMKRQEMGDGVQHEIFINDTIPSGGETEAVQRTSPLDKFLIRDDAVRTTRRVKTSLLESPLEIYSPEQKKPQSIEDLYTKTIPQVRSRLRQQGLKQVGFVRPSHVSDDRFQRLKYHSHHASDTGIPKRQFDPYRHSSYLEDTTLEHFAPKQWTEGHPPDAEDDLIRHALDTLESTFSIITDDGQNAISSGNMVRRTTASGRPWLYHVDIRCEAHHPIALKLVITISQPSKHRILSQLDRSLTLEANKTYHQVTGYLSLDTSTLEEGAYHAHSKIFFLDEPTGSKILLSTHGPFELLVFPGT